MGLGNEAASEEYILGARDSELARLIAQADIHRLEAKALLDRVPIDVGARALDVGCGPVGVLDLLSDRVGSTGEVVGLDNESRMITLAQRAITERELRNVTLLQADAYASLLPAGSFDLAHERLVLNNVTAPDAVVREMVRVVRPGGWVALQDVDWITWTCEPPHPAWNELLAALTASRQAAGLDPYIGRRLPGLLRGAGMVNVDVCAHQYIWRPGDLYHTLLVKFIGIHRERITDGGYLTSERIDELTVELDQHLAHSETLVIYTPLFQAWGHKPYDLPVVQPGAIAAGARSEIGARYRLSGTGRVPAEDQRLSLLEKIFDPVSRRRRSPVQKGWRCLEVGAGRGSMAVWLAEQVGPSGHVVATDIDVSYLDQLDISNLEVRQHNILDDPLGALEPGSFDAVCSRLMLFHLVGRQEQAIQRMVLCLKAGGLLIDEDADCGTTTPADPTHPLFTGFHRAWRDGDWWASRGYDPTFGRKLPTLFERAGLENIHHEATSHVVRGGSPWANWYRESLDVIAQATGGQTAQQRHEHEIITSALADPSVWFLRELLHACSGQRPA